MIKDAKLLSNYITINQNDITIELEPHRPKKLNKYTEIKIVKNSKKPSKVFYECKIEKKQDFIKLYYPTRNYSSYFIALKKDITPEKKLLRKIMFDIIIVAVFTSILIFFYALFLSRMLLVPIKTLSAKLIKMNEKFLSPVETKDMYTEFSPLGESLNKLIKRIQNFTKYQKEFFIGIAHELKTPLAVMKTKNEVTLMRARNTEYYEEAIQKNIDQINEMNQMVTSILEIGRQEGEQLEEPIVFDVVTFIKEKIEDFQLIAKKENRKIITDIKPNTFPALAHPSLLLYIVQNFVQNAMKFSPQEGIITIRTYPSNNGLFIEVLDEGEGIDESIDIFAPFKRYGKKSGAGLGLFLAKNAAQALGGTISVKNRLDSKGVIATFFLPSSSPIGQIK